MIALQELESLLTTNGFPLYRAKQIFNAVYKEGKKEYSNMTVLPADLRKIMRTSVPVFCFEKMREVASTSSKITNPSKTSSILRGHGPSAKRGEHLALPVRAHLAEAQRAKCAKAEAELTIKTLFRLHDEKLMEGVLMRFRDGRNSVCVSSQVGCGLKCGFCATGTMGFIRNLTAEEISDQVLYFQQMLVKEGTRVNHVIFMGMGEPFLNYEAVLEASRLLNDPDAFGIAARHITVSTSGIIPGIEKLAKEPLQINLAVSLHAPNQALREKLMPIAKAYKLPELMKAIKKYIAKTHRRVSYEYVMLKNINDSEALAKELGTLLAGGICHLNLIPYNQTYLGFENAGKSRIDRFAEIVRSFDIPVTVRVSLGQDISAACGQLAVST